MSSLFELEQRIMHAWHVVDDINMLVDMGDEPETFRSLATVYQYRFEHLFREFEKYTAEQYDKKQPNKE